jgi:V/A-type H+-transporting ATPase subunit I
MLKPTPMQKVRIYSLRSNLSEVIEELHKAGLMEINQEKFDGLEDGRPLEFFNVVSEQLVKVRAINAMLEKYSDKSKSYNPKTIGINDAIKRTKAMTVDEELKRLTSIVSEKEADISKLNEKLSIVTKLLMFSGIDFSKLETKTISYRVGEYPSEKLNELKNKLDSELDMYNLVSPDESPSTLVLFKKSKGNIDSILQQNGFGILEIPPETTVPITTKKQLESELADAKKQLEAAKAQLVTLADTHIEEVNDIIHSLKIEADRSEVTTRFGFSKSMVVFVGWVMKKQFKDLEKILFKFDKSAYIEDVPFSHDEVPPTVLSNPKITSPFEYLTTNYSLPNYFELDPSMIYLITLPIIYGMIVGDVFYGVLSLVLAKWLMGKFKDSYIMSNVSRIWYYSAFPTMIWGALFDEWGGAGHAQWLAEFGIVIEPLYPGFHRMANIAMLIAITAIVGILHLTLGFIIGAYNHWNHDRKHSYAKISWIGVLYGGTIAISSIMFGVFPQIVGFFGIGLMIASAIGLALTEGIVGILEIPGLLGNVLSYTRIAAVGIVGVVIAELVNGAFAPVPKAGLFAIILLPIFIILHSLNCFVAMFEALVQGGRLNIVEFRSKFLEGGGRAFMPFSMHLKK